MSNGRSQIETLLRFAPPRPPTELPALHRQFQPFRNRDAHLHAYLAAVAGSARALFEQALERIAVAEGLELAVQGR